MEVQLRNEFGVLLWSRSPVGGQTCRAYGVDGTLHRIEKALTEALTQCRGELTIAMNGNGMGDTCRPTSQVDGDIPMASMRGGDAGR